MEAVVRHAADRYPLNEQRIFGLGWGTGAEAVVAAAAADGSPLRGAMIAMDAFGPEAPAPRDTLRGKAFVVLPGPEDQSSRAAAAAGDWLRENGAHVRSHAGASPKDWESLLREVVAAGAPWIEKQTSGH